MGEGSRQKRNVEVRREKEQKVETKGREEERIKKSYKNYGTLLRKLYKLPRRKSKKA